MTVIDTKDNFSIQRNQVRQVLKKFQDGYKKRDLSQIDSFMDLFLHSDEIELIGIGASMRGGNEWFQGFEAVKNIIEGDWEYWGNVLLDVDKAKISLFGDVAWLSTTGSIEQTSTHDEALKFYLEQMKDILVDEEDDDDTKLLDATHFGMRRLRERLKGQGHQWPFVFTAVLINSQDDWRFHTIHWSMPVD
jgi:hypothetical protein